jgi:2-polyprenyl-3-methyl-5-hydroxy-6-metoxy-1,4-benzoquinol methylase
MNRKQRRAAQSNLHEAEKRHRRTVALEPDDAQAHNELACVLLQQGRLDEAAAQFARAMTLMPELFEQYSSVVATLINVNPVIRAGMARVASASPRELPADEILGSGGLAAISRDPLLRCMLESATVRDLNLERYLTSVRRIMLDIASRPAAAGECVDESMLGLYCALAKQCFINEYVFASNSQETEKASRLRDTLVEALASGQAVAPLLPVATAAYFPLLRLPGSQLLLERAWPAPVRSLLTQQLIEPEEEQQLRDNISRLTGIENDVSVLVKQQYEENPYPRWVTAVSDRGPMRVSRYLRQQFPTASFRDVANDGKIDVLIAGCGTGQQSIVTARRFAEASVLAVDLSLTSLCYAKRMSRVFGVHNVEYAQADVLELASVGRTFHVIEASGVLHHLADPIEGWRVLLAVLRPGGFMHVGLYSKAARAQIRAARAFLAEKEVGPSPSDIRRCRQELLSTPMKSVANYADYFSISECRDLLFHVQEHQLTIPEIDSFLRRHNLQFIGFELAPGIVASYRFRFPEDRCMANLASWHVFETENPATFASMYQFWIQKS